MNTLYAVRWSASWHLAASGGTKTLCGRFAVGAVRASLPGNEKTCERCLLIAAQRIERVEDVPEPVDSEFQSRWSPV